MQKYINTIVKKALDEDLKPHGDITTNLISFKDKKATAKIIAKQNGIIAGLDFCRSAFKLVGKEAIFINKVKDEQNEEKFKKLHRFSVIINFIQMIFCIGLLVNLLR